MIRSQFFTRTDMEIGNINATLLLVALLVSHYLADFCLTMPVMIRAKADGKTLWPIALHAAIHALLMGCCLLIFGMCWTLLLAWSAFEWATHFIIDTAKARLSVAIPQLSDMRHKPYWIVYGLDQLLHQVVVVTIWYWAVV